MTLESDAGPLSTGATQRRRLALLAAMAMAGDRGLSRDKAVALLWPESDAERARHILNQAVYAFRRDLDADVVVDASDLRLNPATIAVDVEAFEQALARGALEEATNLYAGPFLDGFHLSDAGTFERWVDSERARLASRFAQALETLAHEAQAREDHVAAAVWWRRLAGTDPLDARIALELVRALAAAGDRAGAIQHARLHETLMREEMELPPDPHIASLAEELKRQPPLPQQAPPPVTSLPPVMPPPPAVDQPPSAQPAARRPPRRIIRWSVGALAAVAALVIAGLSLRAHARAVASRASTMGPLRVTVLPFAIRGPADLDYLREGMVNLLTTSLAGVGEGSVHPVDPHALLSYVTRQVGTTEPDVESGAALAAHFGARLYTLGEIVELAGRLRVNAALYDRARANADPVATASVEGAKTDLFKLVDQVGATLLTERLSGLEHRLGRAAESSTRSLPALKAYLEGEAQFRAGRYADAVQAFREATVEDTTFALAYYRLSLAEDWSGAGGALRVADADAAVRNSAKLSAHDRALLGALQGYWRLEYDASERSLRAVLAEYPDDVAAWYQLGELLFHDNPVRGRSFAESRGAFEHVLSLDPSVREAYLHLARIAGSDGRRRDLDSLLTTFQRLGPLDRDPEIPVYRAFTLGTAADREHAVASLRLASWDTVESAVWRVTSYGGDVRDAEELLSTLTDRDRPRDVRAFGLSLLGYLRASDGRLHAARQAWDSLDALYPGRSLVYRATLDASPWVPAARAALLADRRDISATPGMPPLGRTFVRPAPQPPDDAKYRQYLLDLIDARLGGEGAQPHGDAALASFQRLANSERGHMPPYEDVEFRLAAALDRAGRSAEATELYESYRGGQIGQLLYYAPSEFALGRLAQQRGASDEAVQHYRRFVRLWRQCDPELRPMVQEAQRQLTALHVGRGDTSDR